MSMSSACAALRSKAPLQPSPYRPWISQIHAVRAAGSVPMAKRLASAQNWAYLIDYWYNGAGTGVPDPSNVIDDVPAATRVLSPQTAIISAGDWNEDEATNGRKGPAEWITTAEFSDSVGGVDGTDADRSDALHDDSRDPCDSGNRGTQGLAKVDYIAWQDSIATRRLQIIFDSATVGNGCNSAFPPELLGFPAPAQASSIASDHLPVIVDVSLPCGNPGLTVFRNGSGINPPCLESQAPPAQISADLNRLQEQLHELHQHATSAANEQEEGNGGGCDAGMVIRGK